MSARICTRSFASRFDSGSSMRKDRRLAHDRAPHRDPLALPAGQRARLALRDTARGRGCALPRRRGGGSRPSAPSRSSAETRCCPGRSVRIERIALEDHRDVAARFGVRSLTTRSPILTTPSLMSSSPATIRSAVVLPQPDGPTSTMNSPSVICRSSLSTARVPSLKTLETSSNSTLAIAHSFTAPPTRPRTSARCEKRKTIATGTTAMRVASASSGLKILTD